ncbi:hypothetical protein MED92_03463 [Oceanospirillum sp. MED92]|uniref:YaeQ family protein n=2 Tax=Neptuniibacter caesariensis TaxID=207954 RepID=A0A7U8C860_NEPCE|nr:hypothetical protein MED92_03463 [Oceanospirillum sp. MED92] [Neptuniibacter caesariensis]
MQYKDAQISDRNEIMALKPTIYKANLNLVDMNQDLYCSEKLTIALHPSETETRMMVRIVAFALNYDTDLSFTKGLSTADEPDLWVVRPDGSIPCWIEVGQASADRLRKGVSRADKVKLYAYGSEVDVWWPKHASDLNALPKTEIFAFDANEAEQLPQLCERNMELTVTISEDHIFVTSDKGQVELKLTTLSS